MTTYQVTAWCSLPHYTTFEVEAASIEDALAKAKIQVNDECPELCDGLPNDWNEFEVLNEQAPNDASRRIEPERAAEVASPALLAALRRFEAAWRSWADHMRTHPGMAESCELFSIYEQARAAIAEATNV
jgi:hypothetical protein